MLLWNTWGGWMLLLLRVSLGVAPPWGVSSEYVPSPAHPCPPRWVLRGTWCRREFALAGSLGVSQALCGRPELQRGRARLLCSLPVLAC